MHTLQICTTATHTWLIKIDWNLKWAAVGIKYPNIYADQSSIDGGFWMGTNDEIRSRYKFHVLHMPTYIKTK